MSANRERIFPHHPTLESPFSGRERHKVIVRDKDTREVLHETGSDGSAIIDGDSVIVKEAYFDTAGRKSAYSLRNVTIEGNYVEFAGEKKP